MKGNMSYAAQSAIRRNAPVTSQRHGCTSGRGGDYSLEALEPRRLLAGAVNIVIGAGQTHHLTGDLTDFSSLTIQGTGPNSVFDGHGFQIIHGALSGNVTISNVRIKNLGRSWINPQTGGFVDSIDNYAIYLSAIDPTTAAVTIEDTIFDTSSSVYIWNGPGSASFLRRNTVLENSLAPGGVLPAVSAPFFTARGPSTAHKVFEDNRIYESFISLNFAHQWLVRGNVIAGDRGGIEVFNSGQIEITDNYIHTLHDFSATNPENPFGSQISSIQMLGSTNIDTHDNVIRDSALAMVRGLSGEFHNNLLLDLLGGDWIINPQSGSKIHHNIFVPKYNGQTVNLGGGITLYDPVTSGVEIHNNTFHGGQGFSASAVHIDQNVTLFSLHNNIFYDFRTPAGKGIVHPGRFQSVSGSPPRPASDPDRMGYANFNAFYNPLAAPGTTNYAVGVEGATYGSDTFGSGDFSGADPRFKSPPTFFPFSDADIKTRLVSIAQILAFYRDAYSLRLDSPLVGQNIGAVPAPVPAVGDANFDGQIDILDYFRIDVGYANRLSGFENGDFNRNGTIDADDYMLIDIAFLARFNGSPSALSAAAPVPVAFAAVHSAQDDWDDEALCIFPADTSCVASTGAELWDDESTDGSFSSSALFLSSLLTQENE
jgi:hypothetical protein